MLRIMVTGSGTEVGKTVVAAILTVLLGADYWKPIQVGEEESSDTATMRRWLDPVRHRVYAPAYSLRAPVSPHHAARLEKRTIDLDKVVVPRTARPLVIETVGGIFVPLTMEVLSVELFKRWEARWVVVSRHYLGSINHTLMTIDVLKRQGVTVVGLFFNGEPNLDSEAAILAVSRLPVLGRLLPEPILDSQIIHRYAQQWKPCLPLLAH